MSVCILQNFENIVLWTDFSASCREINWFSVSKIDPEPAKPRISLALLHIHVYEYLIQRCECRMNLIVKWID